MTNEILRKISQKNKKNLIKLKIGKKFKDDNQTDLYQFEELLTKIKSKNDYNWYPYIKQIVSQKAKAVAI